MSTSPVYLTPADDTTGYVVGGTVDPSPGGSDAPDALLPITNSAGTDPLISDPTSPLITEFERQARLLFPSLPADFITAFATAWTTYADVPGGSDLALADLRNDSRYSVWFPGNLRDDGSARIAEGQYWLQREQYEQAMRNIQVDPGIFSDEDYVSLIEGGTSSVEFASRVRTQANDVLARSDEFRTYYAELYGFEPTNTAILASAFSGSNDALLRQAGIAAVGFEGERRDFDLSFALAASLYDAGVTSQGQATELFGQAASDVPLFGALVERHFDPGDPFDLGSFLDAAVYDDQGELRRMQRLIGQERSLFSRTMQARRAGDAIVGLEAQ